MRYLLVIALITGLILVYLPGTLFSQEKAPSSFTRLTDVEISKKQDGISVIIKSTKKLEYKISVIKDPPRLVIDCLNTINVFKKKSIDVRDEILLRVRVNQFSTKPNMVTRTVLDLAKETPYQTKSEERQFVVNLGAIQEIAKETKPEAPVAVTMATPVQETEKRKLISLDFKEADINNILRILAFESGKNIISGDDIKGKVTISLQNVPWEQALDVILQNQGLVKVEVGNVIRIVSLERLQKESEAKAKLEEAKLKAEAETRIKMAEAKLKESELKIREEEARRLTEELQAKGPVIEEVIRLAYADAEEVAKTLRELMGIKEGEVRVLPTAPISPLPSLPGLAGTQTTTPATAPSVPTATSGISGLPGFIGIHKQTNTVLIRDYKSNVERIKKLIAEKLDIATPQVSIEARIEAVSKDYVQQLGIQWGGTMTAPINPKYGTYTFGGTLPAATGSTAAGSYIVNLPTTSAPVGGMSFGFVGSNINLNLILQALEQQGKAKKYATPYVTTLENVKATMSHGYEVPYVTSSTYGTNVQFKDALIKLEVTPHVIFEDDVTRIKMKIRAEKNEPDWTKSVGGNPPLIKRTAETEVLVKDGDRVIIGGVTNEEKATTVTGVPVLSQIPILGWLFKKREIEDKDLELMIIIMPRMIRK